MIKDYITWKELRPGDLFIYPQGHDLIISLNRKTGDYVSHTWSLNRRRFELWKESWHGYADHSSLSIDEIQSTEKGRYTVIRNGDVIFLKDKT